MFVWVRLVANNSAVAPPQRAPRRAFSKPTLSDDTSFPFPKVERLDLAIGIGARRAQRQSANRLQRNVEFHALDIDAAEESARAYVGTTPESITFTIKLPENGCV